MLSCGRRAPLAARQKGTARGKADGSEGRPRERQPPGPESVIEGAAERGHDQEGDRDGQQRESSLRWGKVEDVLDVDRAEYGQHDQRRLDRKEHSAVGGKRGSSEEPHVQQGIPHSKLDEHEHREQSDPERQHRIGHRRTPPPRRALLKRDHHRGEPEDESDCANGI